MLTAQEEMQTGGAIMIVYVKSRIFDYDGSYAPLARGNGRIPTAMVGKAVETGLVALVLPTLPSAYPFFIFISYLYPNWIKKRVLTWVLGLQA